MSLNALTSEGACLNKVLFTDDNILTVESLQNRRNRRQLLKNRIAEYCYDNRSHTFCSLGDDLGWYLCHWEDFAGFYRANCEMNATTY